MNSKKGKRKQKGQTPIQFVKSNVDNAPSGMAQTRTNARVEYNGQQNIVRHNFTQRVIKAPDHDQVAMNDHEASQAIPAHVQTRQAELATEHAKLVRQLESYIAEFESKLKALHFKPTPKELIVLFVMNLHPRWKRLVEPMEITFSDWRQAAEAARYHAIKLSAILGAERDDTDLLFTTPESKDLLTHGYFVRDDHPGKSYFPKPPPASILSQKQTKPPASDTTTATNPSDTGTLVVPEESKPESSKTANTKTRSAAKSRKKGSGTGAATATVASQSATKSDADVTAEIKTMLKLLNSQNAQNTQTTEDMASHDVERVSKQNVCYYAPKEHLGVSLPFLELKIAGHKVRALLSKKRWGASVISLALQNLLGLKLDRKLGYDIGTDFGNVEDGIGAVELSIQHPADPEGLRGQMLVQCLPVIYGGLVDLVFGADFFHLFDALFDFPNKSIRFLGAYAPIIIDTL